MEAEKHTGTSPVGARTPWGGEITAASASSHFSSYEKRVLYLSFMSLFSFGYDLSIKENIA